MRLYPVEFIDSKWFEDFENKISDLINLNKKELEGKIESSNLIFTDRIDDIVKDINYRIDVENKNITSELDVLEVRNNTLDNKLFEYEKEIKRLTYKCENLDRALHSYIDDQKKLQNRTMWDKIKGWLKREFGI
jgi:predicted RNase H-like nuclease (RuvC/YqgF family)